MVKNAEERVLDQTNEPIAPVMRVYMRMHRKLPNIDFAGAFGALHRHLRAYCCRTGAAIFDIEALVSAAVHRTFTAGRIYLAGPKPTAVP